MEQECRFERFRVLLLHGLDAAFHVTHLFFAEFLLLGVLLTEVGL
jgi:hypothetical protein